MIWINSFAVDVESTQAMYVCICHAVTDHAIEQAAEEGVRSMKELTFKTGCASQCGSCATSAQEVLAQANRRIEARLGPPALLSTA